LQHAERTSEVEGEGNGKADGRIGRQHRPTLTRTDELQYGTAAVLRMLKLR
jgi:hypothetical protein